MKGRETVEIAIKCNERSLVAARVIQHPFLPDVLLHFLFLGKGLVYLSISSLYHGLEIISMRIGSRHWMHARLNDSVMSVDQVICLPMYLFMRSGGW